MTHNLPDTIMTQERQCVNDTKLMHFITLLINGQALNTVEGSLTTPGKGMRKVNMLNPVKVCRNKSTEEHNTQGSNLG
jgi:hypothetical protein